MKYAFISRQVLKDTTQQGDGKEEKCMHCPPTRKKENMSCPHGKGETSREVKKKKKRHIYLQKIKKNIYTHFSSEDNSTRIFLGQLLETDNYKNPRKV